MHSRSARSASEPSTAHRRGAIVLLLAALAAIAVATLHAGDPARAEPTSFWCLLCGSFGAIDVAQNIVLFVPLGVALQLLGVRRNRAVLVGFGLSAAVEAAQLLVLVGRDPSLSDLTTNSLGTLLGTLLGAHWRQLLWPGPRTAALLCALVLTGWLATDALAAWALQRDVPTDTGYWTNPVTGRRNPSFVPFTGEVRDVRLGGAPLASDKLRDASMLLPRLRERPLALTARLRPGPAEEREQLIASVFTFESEPVLLLSRVGDDLRFHVRTRAERLRLRGPSVLLANVFGDAGDEWLDVGGRLTDASLEVWARDARGTRVARVPRSPRLGWSLVWPFELSLARWAVPLGALWLATPLLLAAYWGGRAAPRRPRLALGVLALLVALALATLPVAASLTAPRGWTWLTAGTAIAVGWQLARVSLRAHLAPAGTGRQYIRS